MGYPLQPPYECGALLPLQLMAYNSVSFPCTLSETCLCPKVETAELEPNYDHTSFSITCSIEYKLYSPISGMTTC